MSYAVVAILIFISSFAIFMNARIEHRLEQEEKLQELAKTLIHIRDNERKRIAMDIHDSLVHRLRELKGYTDAVLTDSHKEHISSEISAIIELDPFIIKCHIYEIASLFIIVKANADRRNHPGILLGFCLIYYTV